ncbi:sugar-binding domain protein [Brevibacillus laterosporus]|uniref:sugar-binding domain protein n=1 Tax=Brevibacillus laterosporus TaxID=1465 RepID=UPI00264ABE7B|nr:sugar-binding domain protein [Brevibacillus laterosporus]MDN9009172.1 sugar-binding domain protein [Brevibacillus laterosporus]MDO0939941.1 sugar-binding domain protein [Brevibacillus laterosporus]
MNKKVILSVLSTALVTSMATSAFAASGGIYIGGKVDRFYSDEAFIKQNAMLIADLYDSGLENVENSVLYVNWDGKAATLQEMMDAKLAGKEVEYKTVTSEDFEKIGGEEGFYAVDAQGKVSTEKEMQPEQKPVTPGDLVVESVSAITKTKVEVKFNKAIDSIDAKNFTIAGATVEVASLSEDKKTATLTVSGLNYDTEYTIVAKDVLVDGKPITLKESKFKTPVITDLYKLELTTDAAGDQLKSDGVDTLVITAKLLDKVTGVVDENADNVVISFSTTYGNLANTRVTVQKGIATVTLRSEFSQKDLVAKVDAQVIEASGDYKHLIGKVIGTKEVFFKVNPDGPGEIEQLPAVVSAGSNQADRVTVNFSKNVSVEDFVQKDETTGLYKVDSDGNALLKNGTKINIIQDKVAKKVRGLKPVDGNKKALEVILDRNEVDSNGIPTQILADNKAVEVEFVQDSKVGPQTTKADFILADARKPEATSVTAQGLKEVAVKFSESIAKADVSIDGGLTKISKIKFGEFDQTTLKDTRDIVTIETVDYLKAGVHSVQLSSIFDFAGLTDDKNISTSQTLDFKVKADNAIPSSTVSVESPEQFRVTFNKLVDGLTADKVKLQVAVKNVDGTESWVNVADAAGKYTVTPELAMDHTAENKNEYVFELKNDWTEIYDTKVTTKNYYNDKYRLFIPANSVTNPANGKQNADIEMLLNGTIMTTPDTVSPTIKDITQISTGRYNVEMSKPVKLPGKDLDTPSQSQPKVPEPIIEFLGKDKDGNTKTIKGKVVDYTDKNRADKQFEVVPTPDKPEDLPQTIVNNGGDIHWTLVVRSISDDVGNTAETLTKVFEIKPNAVVADEVFMVKGKRSDNTLYNGVVGAENGKGPDTITLTFTSGVQYTGSEKNAVNPANYTLDGENLPKGSILTVSDSDDNPENGYDTVIISLPDGTLETSKGSNLITVSKSLESYKGAKLTGEYAITFVPEAGITPDEAKVADAVAEAISNLPSVDKLTLSDEATLVNVRTQYNALTAIQQKAVKNLKVLEAAEKKMAELKKAAGDVAANLAAAKTAVTDLETAIGAGKDLTKEADLLAAEAALKTAKEKVALVADANEKKLLEAKVTLAEKTVTDARAKFDGDAATALKDAKAAVEALETAAKADLTVETNLTAAETAVAAAETAVAKVAAGAEKTELEGKVTTAKKTVTDARTEFDKVAKEAAELKAAKDALEQAITEAKAQNNAAVAGSAKGEYPQAAKDAYDAEIQKAEAVFNNVDAKKDELEAAKAALDAATTTFEGTVNP